MYIYVCIYIYTYKHIEVNTYMYIYMYIYTFCSLSLFLASEGAAKAREQTGSMPPMGSVRSSAPVEPSHTCFAVWGA